MATRFAPLIVGIVMVRLTAKMGLMKHTATVRVLNIYMFVFTYMYLHNLKKLHACIDKK